MMKIPEPVTEVLAALEQQGYEAWCVGGCVRDLLRGETPADWDVTTSALPGETMAVFGSRAVPTGLRHGTVTVRTAGGPVEVTTFRRDGAYPDHRRPDRVLFTSSLEEDLCRRDFTINAMALDRHGRFRDPFGGRADLQAKVLRCVGDPDRRFGEDALRILRGLRFASRLGCGFQPDTGAAIHRCRGLLAEIAPERIWAELSGLLRGPWVSGVLREYPDVLGVFWPEVLDMVGFEQKNRHHCYDVWEHTLHALETSAEEDTVLRCALLLHDVGKPRCFTMDEAGVGHFYGHPAMSCRMAEEMLGRLRTDNATKRDVTQLVAWHDRDIPRTDRGIRRALAELGEPALRRLLALKRADNLAQAPEYRGVQREIALAEEILERQLAEGACVSLRQLAVRGGDLLGVGLQGPAVGRTLAWLLEAVVDGTLPNERTALLDAVRRKNGC